MAINQTQRGFALLISVIFMSVMLAFGLALASLAYKQQILAASATRSQYAFYAADAGLECALYADQKQTLFAYPTSVPSSAPTLVCDGINTVSASYSNYPAAPGAQWIVRERLSLDSSTSHPRCADVTVYKPNGLGQTLIFSQGYDVPCSTVGDSNARYVARGISIHY